MISFGAVNWLAVVVGMVLSMAMGALWYGPLFGNLWLRLIGKTADEIEGDPMDYLKTAVAAFIAMLFLDLVVASFGAQSLADGVVVGALTFIGFGATLTFVYTTFEGPDERVWLLYAAYQLVVFVIMGGVFAVWN
ncbi:MAG: DUF1761 domain-containing protein [Anaerolineales bacterium]|jgi:hypothetical protein